MTTITATYSPEDNKIRLRASSRLDAETYERVKAAGYSWAPKQDLFYAPRWTPARYDLAVELAGEVGDEDTTLVSRAEERADRFTGYSANRASDAGRAAAGVEAIAGNIPFGQPILVGHHSERRARKDAEKIQRGMEKAVKMWETSEYWQQRAAGALHHAKYKELPRVRAKRIKTLGAEMRVHERSIKELERTLALWSKDGLTLEQARIIAGNYGTGFTCAMTADNARGWSAYDVLKSDADRYKECPSKTVAECVEIAKRVFPRAIAKDQRWIEHYKNRIAYETAMLDEQGAAHLLDKPARPKQAMILNTPDAVTLKGMYRNGPETHTPRAITKAQYAKVPNDYKACRHTVDGYRVRVVMQNALDGPREGGYNLIPVFLTDSKVNKAEVK